MDTALCDRASLFEVDQTLMFGGRMELLTRRLSIPALLSLTFLVFGVNCMVAQTPPPSVSVQADITGEDADNVEGAQLVLSPRIGSKTAKQISAAADGRGKVALGSVPPGDYTICISALRGELLNPCEWSPETSVIKIESGRNVPSLPIHLKKGATLRIYVEDPDQLAPTPFAKDLPGTFFEPGVWAAGGFYHPAHYVSSDEKGHIYEMVIPTNTDFKFGIIAIGMDVLDGTGAKASLGGIVRAQPNGKPITLNFRVAKMAR